MPIVVLHTKSQWSPYGAHDPALQRPWSDEWELTYGLVSRLRGYAAEAVNVVDNTHFHEEDVALQVKQFGPWDQNVYDMWIDLQPGGDPEDEKRRWNIARNLQTQVNLFLARYPLDLRPGYDVECRPINGSGMSIDQDGSFIQRWGLPTAE